MNVIFLVVSGSFIPVCKPSGDPSWALVGWNFEIHIPHKAESALANRPSVSEPVS